ncbi:MAG TPA: hypothetical protein VGW76_11450 [Pyrinomonadaceae bacterium]|nr:hypothetical protein [Pyrinomonadaceae bacterium]
MNSNDGISSFLQTMLPKVEINKAASLRDALNELLKIPEVRRQEQRYLGSRLIQGFAYGFGQAAKPDEREKLSLSATNVTVREALNLIALKGGAVWLLSPTRCKGRAIYSIDFVAKQD